MTILSMKASLWPGGRLAEADVRIIQASSAIGLLYLHVSCAYLFWLAANENAEDLAEEAGQQGVEGGLVL